MPEDGERDGASEAGEASRPAFAADFPRHPALDALVTAFEAGNFARVRAGAAEIAASPADEAVKQASAALLARTKPDPLAGVLIVLTAVLLIALAAFWVAHNGPAAAPP